MGRKTKDKKKGKGAEKTATKTEKKLNAKFKKELALKGEDDIEQIVAQIEKEEQARLAPVEKTLKQPPTRRGNFTLIPHPDKDELILFGGEFFNGQKTFVYNDLYFYNISKNEWTTVKAPGGPAPVCGHQMIATSTNKGQLWVFGGEFTSVTQSQFYHYRTLWCYHMAEKKWEKITAPNGPSARSGHRMVCLKKQIFVFGGFHDNLRDYKYFNDVYCFNMESYEWVKLDVVGTPPAPRSGCNMVVLADGRIAVFGGYSRTRLKKDVDKGQVHTDMFILAPDKHDPTKWKWSSAKQGGAKPSPRCSMPITTFNNRAYVFGGVFDTEAEDEEDICGTFYNDLFCLDLEKIQWRKLTFNRTKNEKKVEEPEVVEETPQMTVTSDDGVFTVSVGAATSSVSSVMEVETKSDLFWPSGRMNCGLAIKRGVLYLYGGMVENGDKQLTFNDLYSLDLHKMDEWKVLVEDLQSQEWFDSESEEDEDEDDDESSEDDEDEMDTD